MPLRVRAPERDSLRRISMVFLWFSVQLAMGRVMDIETPGQSLLLDISWLSKTDEATLERKCQGQHCDTIARRHMHA